MYQHVPFYGPPKFNQIGIFGLKANHLATRIISPEPRKSFATILKALKG
jgi:hypothetical protein